MKNGVTLITPTGDRQETFELCVRFMQRQTHTYDQWIIVDDGDTNLMLPSETDSRAVVLNRIKTRNEASFTLRANLVHALGHVENDIVLDIEDDDWYSPDYIQFMKNLFKINEKLVLVGQGNAIYYHIPSRSWFPCLNENHASLCQTGFRSRVIPWINKICDTLPSGNHFIDTALWSQSLSKCLNVDGPPRCVGMKGLPGRGGIGSGHRHYNRFKRDPRLLKLRQLIGDDISNYKKWI